jgi:restriction system protein
MENIRKMPIPTIREIEQAIPQCLTDGKEYHRRDIINKLATNFKLTPEELEETLPSGRKRFLNRFGTALVYSHQAGMVKSSRLGYWRITSQGVEVLQEGTQPQLDLGVEGLPPEVSIEENYQRAKEELAEQLLQQIIENSPDFFEELVLDLLVEMGYGGSRADAEAVGRSGDGGIDGIIKEDRLGLDLVYVQAKRFNKGSVGAPQIASFAGALAAKGANKGIFITTSNFTKAAKAYDAAGFQIVLIDGDQLVQLMIDHNVGVSTERTYEIKQIDADYFEEEE